MRRFESLLRGHLACIVLLAMGGTVALRAEPMSSAVEADASVVGRPLLQVLQEIQSRGVDLLFTSQLVDPRMVISAEPRSSEPRERLEELLRPFGLTTRDGPQGARVIIPRPGGGPGSGIHGQVLDVRRQTPLEGVQVLLPGTAHQGVTDAQGRFHLMSVPPGTYALEARKPGFVVEQLEAFEVPPWGFRRDLSRAAAHPPVHRRGGRDAEQDLPAAERSGGGPGFEPRRDRSLAPPRGRPLPGHDAAARYAGQRAFRPIQHPGRPQRRGPRDAGISWSSSSPSTSRTSPTPSASSPPRPSPRWT